MKRSCLILLSICLLLSCSGEKKSTIPPPDKTEGGSAVPENLTSLTVYGKVLDEKGNPYVGVVMTDGYNFTVTDEDGFYRFEKYRYASFVQCSIPADAVITTGGTYNLPECHFKRISSTSQEYNFTYTRQEPELRFRILALGDPQFGSETHVTRYLQTAVPDVRQYVVNSEKIPTYGMTLGDNVGNAWELFPDIADALGKMSVPVFATIGNHDHEFPTENETASRKKYEQVFGPSNYSFNRGNYHIVSFDDVLFEGTASGDYDEGFEEWQYEWLKNDLSYVPTGKSIIFATHIPLKNTRILELLSPFKSVIAMFGHTHKVENTYNKTVNGNTFYMSAVGSTGAPWKGLVLSDGCMRGYKVYEFNGNTLSREIYKSITLGEDFQIRMFRTNDFPAFTTPTGIVLKFAYYGDDYIAVNVFNYKSNWKVSLWEDGVMTSSSPIVKASYDMWVKMFLYRYYNRDNNVGVTDHMLFFRLKNPSAASIRVEATDEYGTTYSCEYFTTEKDIPNYND